MPTTGFQIDLDILTKVVEWLLLLAGAWFGLKSQVRGLSISQKELRSEVQLARAESKAADVEQLRQLEALHKRLDTYGKEIQRLDKQNAVIWDRLNRTTQRVAPQQDGNPFGDGWTPNEGTPE